MSVLRGEKPPASPWTEQDSLLAQALTVFEAMVCPGCGHPLHETMDPASEGQWVAGLPMRCHACTAIGHRAKNYVESEVPAALRFGAVLRSKTT